MRGLGILILATIYLTAQACPEYRVKFHGNFFPAVNRALIGKVLDTKTTRSRVICMRECAMLPLCISINFHDASNLCELNTATRLQFPDLLMEVHGSVYFDAHTDTPSFSVPHFISCMDLLHSGFTVSGQYTLYPNGFDDGLLVYCDMETDGGGWIVIQRRQDGSVDFYRNWETYRAGFGDLSGEFWIGNDVLLNLTKFTGWWTLRVELEDWESNTVWAEYGEFGVYGDFYNVRIGQYNKDSILNDSLTWHNGHPFSTYDADHDKAGHSCAEKLSGGWWYGYCTTACLNGRYSHQARVTYRKGIQWQSWKGNKYSMKRSSMKIK